MTRFIESFSTQLLRPPWVGTGATTHGFVFEVTGEAIQGYLDKYFNIAHPDGPPFVYSIIPDALFGMIAFCDQPSVATLKGPKTSQLLLADRTWDHVSYREAYLAIPVSRRRTGVGGAVDEVVTVWTQPFTFATNSTVVFASREVWGVDMSVGQVELAVNAEDGSLHLDTYMRGVEVFSPRSKDEWVPFLHVTTGPPVEPDFIDLLIKHPEFASFLNVVGLGTAKNALSPSETELNTLKQYRNAYNLLMADYQAIVASHSTHENIRNVKFYDPSEVDLRFMWSDSTKELLKNFLKVETPSTYSPPPPHTGPEWSLLSAKVPVLLAFSMSSDVYFKVIDTIQTFGFKG